MRLKLVKFYSDGELSSIQMSNEEETVSGVKNLFFSEQLTEEQIMLEIYSQNKGLVSEVDELRLDFDRIYTKKQLKKKALFSLTKLVDSCQHTEDFSIQTILSIKNEQRYLNASFRGYKILVPRTKLLRKPSEPLLFATLKNDNYYLLNKEQSQFKPSLSRRIIHWFNGLFKT